MSDYGDRIKELRAIQSITQTELAERSGLSLSLIGRAERGHEGLAIGALDKIAKALGVTAGALMGAPASNEPMRMEFIIARAHETAIMALNTATLASKLHAQALQAANFIIENDCIQYMPFDVQHALLELTCVKK